MGRLKALQPRVKVLGSKPATAGPWATSAAKSTTERGYGWAWQQLRERVMTRDCGMCQPCLKAGRATAANAVDHIVNKAAGGSDDESNLQSICEPCHKAKTAAEAHQGGSERWGGR